MVITFDHQRFEVRVAQIKPSQLRLGDILLGPGGNLLKVCTIQRGCPIWESNRRTENHYILETENHEMVPVRTMPEQIRVFRKKR